MQLSEKQNEYWNNATKRWNIKSGATRSGKTYLDYFLIPKRIRQAGSGLIVLVGNTKNTIERNVLAPMRTKYGEKMVGTISSNNNQVRLFGRTCHVLGAEKVNQVSKIQGAGISYCYGDEVTTWHADVFNMLKSRLSEADSIFDGTCNPEGPKHWLKKFLDSDAEIFAQSYCIDDNPFLPPEFVENLKKEYSGTVYYDRFILGKWIPAEGIIYRQFADNPHKFTTTNDSDVAYARIGVDFGGNKSAHAFYCVGISADFKRVKVLDEFYLKKEISPEELENKFCDFVVRNKEKYPVWEARCDSAETTLIKGLQAAVTKRGIVIDIKKAMKKRITDRIRFVNVLISLGRFSVMEHCSKLIGAMCEAVWDEKKNEDVRLDNGELNVDSLDAMEYAVEPDMDNILMLR